MQYDVVVIGGGPAGLSAALMLARGCKRVLLCDAGPARNAAAHEVHGFVTQDGVSPAEFRRTARTQLARYPGVEIREERVLSIDGERGQFQVTLPSGAVGARRILLCVGMIDEIPALPGFRELWGRAIFLCPYCHGWEVRDLRFGYLAPSPQWLEWALFLKGWTREVRLFTSGLFEVPEETRAKLAQGGVSVEERPIRRLISRADQESGATPLEAIELADGALIPCDVLFARPPQRQVPLVHELGLDLDEQGFVRVDPQRQTSRPGIYAAGDLITMMQGAVMAAAAGAVAAAMLNHELTVESVLTPSA